MKSLVFKFSAVCLFEKVGLSACLNARDFL